MFFFFWVVIVRPSKLGRSKKFGRMNTTTFFFFKKKNNHFIKYIYICRNHYRIWLWRLVWCGGGLGTLTLKHPFDGYPGPTDLTWQGLKAAGLVNPSMKQTSIGASTMVSLIPVSKVLIPAPLASILTLGEIINLGSNYWHFSLLWEETMTLDSSYRHQSLSLKNILTLSFSYWHQF